MKLTGSTIKFGGTFLRQSRYRDALLYLYATHDDDMEVPPSKSFFYFFFWEGDEGTI